MTIKELKAVLALVPDEYDNRDVTLTVIHPSRITKVSACLSCVCAHNPFETKQNLEFNGNLELIADDTD